MRPLSLAVVTAATLLVAGTPASAACTDAKGRLTKCPKPADGKIRCKDDKGHKAKCGLPGTHPVD